MRWISTEPDEEREYCVVVVHFVLTEPSAANTSVRVTMRPVTGTHWFAD
jgi:hypothetical protein